MKENIIKEVYHAKSVKEIYNKFSSNSNEITSQKEANYLKKYGTNTIPEKKGKNPVLIFLRQFNSFLIYILIIAAGISYAIDNFIDFYIIIGIIFINATIGFCAELCIVNKSVHNQTRYFVWRNLHGACART